jgi:polyvinyl alcohol dehydrogenase (cytochrome)
LMIKSFVAALALMLVGFDSAAQAAPQAPQPNGEALYKEHCASCHETGVPRAANRAALAKIAPDNVRFTLTKGTMTAQASKLTAAEIDAVVRFVAAPAPPASAAGVANPCPKTAVPPKPFGSPNWNGWGVNPAQHRFQPASMAQLSADQVPSLKLKWAFGFPGVSQAYAQPTVVGGRIFVGSAGRKVYSLSVESGCQYWVFDTEAPVRAAITIAVNGNTWTAYVADQGANVYALNAITGAQLWKREIDNHPSAVITGAPSLSGKLLYVSTSSSEEGTSVTPTYECCKFRGSVTALDAATGTLRWRTFTIADEPRPTRKSAGGTQLWGPSGAAVWSSPTVDAKTRRVYITTGDGYSDPVANTTDAFMAFDADSGKLIWSRQMTANDAYVIGCELPAPLNANCPQANGPDLDFGSSPMLIDLPGGRRALIAGQKSGVVHAVNPETGEILWQRRVGQGGKVGGVQWGSAYDGTNIYVALSDVVMAPAPPGTAGAQPSMLGAPMLLDSKAGGGLFAMNPQTGAAVWSTPHPGCQKPGCSPAQSAAITAIPGVIFSGGLDGHLRAYAANDGRIIWDVDTIREYETVNGIKATGGSLDGPGPVVVGGAVFVNSGYSFVGGTPGNVLLAFSVDGK